MLLQNTCTACPHHTLPPPLTAQVPDISVPDAQKNFKKSMEKGILKILSKMGISLLSCYHGAQIFEIYGLGKDVVELCFKGSVSRIGGWPGAGGGQILGHTAVGWAVECQLCCTPSMCCSSQERRCCCCCCLLAKLAKLLNSSKCFWSSRFWR
jgi:hypothetical protein